MAYKDLRGWPLLTTLASGFNHSPHHSLCSSDTGFLSSERATLPSATGSFHMLFPQHATPFSLPLLSQLQVFIQLFAQVLLPQGSLLSPRQPKSGSCVTHSLGSVLLSFRAFNSVFNYMFLV